MINCGVIGLGNMGRSHAEAIRRHDDAHLVQIYDPLSPDSGSMALADIINNPQIAHVTIASPDDKHFEQVIYALESGKHVFVEKPMCRTHAELSMIYSTVVSKKLSVVSNLLLRTAPLYLWLKEKIIEGFFGEIYAFDANYLYGRIQKLRSTWRSNVPDYSVMQGGGIHMVDLMLWLLGERPETVFSQTNKIATKADRFSYPDFSSARFVFSSGLIGTITANFACVHPHQHALRIFGTKATFLLDDQGPRIITQHGDDIRPQPVDKAQKPDKKTYLLERQLSSIVKSDLSDSCATHDFDVMKAVISADDSARFSNPVQIEYIK